METWVLYGLIAAVFLAVSGLLSKIASGTNGLEPHVVGLLVVTGAVIVLGAYYLLESKGNFTIPPNNLALLAALGSGAAWGLGVAIVYNGFKLGANASQMIPLYNVNTLIAVVLAILVLHELPNPEQTIKVGAGAILMMIGAFLVS